jgi:hypothetical protein
VNGIILTSSCDLVLLRNLSISFPGYQLINPCCLGPV